MEEDKLIGWIGDEESIQEEQNKLLSDLEWVL